MSCRVKTRTTRRHTRGLSPVTGAESSVAETIALLVGLVGATFVVYRIVQGVAVFIGEVSRPHDPAEDDDDQTTAT
jgi:hypothetical protein